MRTIAEEMQLAGLKSLLAVSGFSVTSSAGDVLRVIIDEAPELNDPVDNMRARGTVYVRVQCAYGDVADPRTITSFSDADGRSYAVKRFEEKHHTISHNWICEAQRKSQW